MRLITLNYVYIYYLRLCLLIVFNQHVTTVCHPYV